MNSVVPEAPRAVRIIELGEDGAPTFKSLLIVEVGTRLVFSMRPTSKVSLVRTTLVESPQIYCALD